MFCFLENRSVFNEGEKSMYDEKTREKLIRETAESIYQYYPMACKMVICFLSYNNRKVSGYVKSVYYDNRPFYFEGLDHLLLLMEDIMDTTDYPQVTVDYHNLKGKTFKRQSDIFKAYDDRKMVSLFADEEIKDAGPKKKIACVQVISRKNSSIQGELSINAKVKVFFRSGIELMQLLYELMEDWQRETSEPEEL